MELRIYKYRIYPSKKQKIRLIKQFQICKEIYNTLLAENKKLWTTNKYDFNSLVNYIKITCPEYYFQAHSQVLQNVSDRLHKAFDNFFRRVKCGEKAGYPRFKSRIQSITYPQSGFKFVSDKRLYVSKIGNIPIILHRIPRGKIKTMTVKVNKANQWFACFSSKFDTKEIEHPSKEKVGIDVGLEHFATFDNGETVDNPHFLIKSERRLKMLQRRLSRKKKGSANREKARFRLAKQHIKVTNQRNDFLHKLSRSLTVRYNIIAVEDLNINGMMKNHIFAKSIADVGWRRFIEMLSYKAVTSGGQLLKNPRTKGSSHRCSNCGFYIENISLSKRKFSCPKCGNVLHRDHNSALNHLKDTVGLTEISTPVDIRPPQQSSSVACLIVEAGTTYGK